MPEATAEVRWPDGRLDRVWSPSLVIHDHLAEGEAYPVAEFVDRCATALELGSERVRAKFGFACTASAASRARVEQTAAAYDGTALVAVLRVHPPLPDEVGR